MRWPPPFRDGRYGLEHVRISLANKMGARRKAVGLTQAQLARLARVRVETISRLENALHMPGARTFALTGNASVNPDASDAAVDRALGVPSRVTAEASESLPGCIQCRASAAADGDPSTAWNTPPRSPMKTVSALTAGDDSPMNPASPVEYFQRVFARMKDAGCDAVVLGCTEIPLIMNDANSPLPTLDSTRLLARAALRRAL